VEILRPIPDRDFELVSFGNDPTKCFKLGKGIPEPARAQLVACLKENVKVRKTQERGGGVELC